MSKRTAFGLAFVEKILGLIITFIGAALIYYSYVNPDAAGMAGGYIIAGGVCLTVLGIILLIAKTG